MKDRRNHSAPSAGRIGVLGGSFNPIHNGHLAMAAAAREAHGLDRVLLMPAGQPPHKPLGLASRHHRLRMVELACAAQDGLEPCDIEVRRDGVQYTVDSLRELHSTMPGAAFFFIIGADTLLDFPNWRAPGEILRLARLVVVNRPGYPLSLTAEQIPVPPPWPSGVTAESWARIAADQVSMKPMPIESTEIRREVAHGNSVLQWLPPAVAQYISRHRLYRDETTES